MRNPVKHLAACWLGRPYYFFEQLGSTSTVLADLAAGGAPGGTVVAAGYQAQGRGRGRRTWQAPPNTSLLFSVLLRPDWPAQRAHWLTMIAALAVVSAVESAAPLSLALKWPNDVMLWDAARPEPAWCKMGGILLETQLYEDRVQQAILGIGLNVNIPRDALPPGPTPASSLLAAGHPQELAPLLATILQRLETLYEQAAAGQSPQPAWDARLLTRDRHVRVTAERGVVEGTALGSDEWGRLLVRDTRGVLHHFSAADVTLRPDPPTG